MPSTMASRAVLQRRCACGAHTMGGGECAECQKTHVNGKPLQTKLAISEPGDVYEQEADRVAEQVMRMSPANVSRRLNIRAAQPMVQRRVTGGTNELAEVPLTVQDVFNSPDQPLDTATRTFFEPRFGHDFSRVRIHTGAAAATVAAALGARALTIGEHILFGKDQYRPHVATGRGLFAHELTHVTQQRSGAATPAVQRKIAPEDVSVEMIGREFELAALFKVGAVTLAAGTRVKPIVWVNTSNTVPVMGTGILGAAVVPKTLLRPVHAAGAGVAPYSAGVAPQAAAVETAEQKLAVWVAGQANYKTQKALALFKKERARLEDLLKNKQGVLNRRLIQETMFNRFDAVIKKDVDAANAAHGLTGAAALDPNLVKSMLFQESQLGTAGTHLEQHPIHPVKTRFNLGQVIDSSGLALLTLFEKEHPVAISLQFLLKMRTDLVAAQNERAVLKKKASLNAAETTRLAELNGLAAQNWETFIWGYKASGPLGAKFADVVALFFGATMPARNLDYEFWIHMAVFWLFEKHKSGMSWPDVIKAYNGSGKRAQDYRDAVVKRAGAGAAAAKAGTDFVPEGI